MPYLDRTERETLLNELKGMRFNQAKGKLRRLDPKARLAFLRNNQGAGQWLTRYELPSLGTRVTLVEEYREKPAGSTFKSDYELIKVLVEPTPENRT
jgi:hypothetical protein